MEGTQEADSEAQAHYENCMKLSSQISSIRSRVNERLDTLADRLTKFRERRETLKLPPMVQQKSGKKHRGGVMATRKHRRRSRRGGGLLSTGLGALKNLKAEDLKSAVTSAAKNLKPEDLKSAVSTGKDLLAQQQAQPVAEEKPIDTAGVQNLVNAVGAQFKESSDSDSGKITITFDRDDILRLIEKRGGRKTRRKRKSRKSA